MLEKDHEQIFCYCLLGADVFEYVHIHTKTYYTSQYFNVFQSFCQFLGYLRVFIFVSTGKLAPQSWFLPARKLLVTHGFHPKIAYLEPFPLEHYSNKNACCSNSIEQRRWNQHDLAKHLDFWVWSLNSHFYILFQQVIIKDFPNCLTCHRRCPLLSSRWTRAPLVLTVRLSGLGEVRWWTEWLLGAWCSCTRVALLQFKDKIVQFYMMFICISLYIHIESYIYSV